MTNEEHASWLKILGRACDHAPNICHEWAMDAIWETALSAADHFSEEVDGLDTLEKIAMAEKIQRRALDGLLRRG